MGKWWTLVAVCMGTFVLLVDVTILTVALPDMAVGLRASLADLQWVINVYALALAALLLGMGSMADHFGRRRMYLTGLVIYAFGALACAVAPTIGLLIAARFAQGVGAAAMFATIVALLGVTYQGRDRGLAFGVWGAVNSAAVAAGPMMGGLLTQHLGWRWIFVVNLLISLLTIALVLRAVTESRDSGNARVDLAGIGSFTIAAGATTFALIRVHDAGWTSASTLGLLGVGVTALVVFILVERRQTNPMLDLRLFRNASFVGVMVGAFLLQAAAFAYLPYLALGLRSVLDLDPVTTGLVLLPQSVAAFVLSLVAGRFLHRVSPQWTIGVGLLLIGAGALLQAGLDGGSTAGAIVLGLVVAGLGVGMATPTLASAAVGAVPVQRAGMAGGAVNTFRQLGYAMGIAVLGGIFSSSVAGTLSTKPEVVPDVRAATEAVTGGKAQGLIEGSPAGVREAVHDLVREAFAAGMNTTYLVAGITGLVGAVLVLVLVRKPAQSETSLKPAGALAAVSKVADA